MYESIETNFQRFLMYGIIGVEIIGALIVFFYTFKALFYLLTAKQALSKHALTEGISTGLSFLLGSEVLKTIIAPDWSAIGMTCAILLMRAGMTLLVHWENKMEKKMEAGEESASSVKPAPAGKK